MGDGDAEGFFHAVGGIEDVLLVDGLNEFGGGVADFGRDEFEVIAVWGPKGKVLGAGLGGASFLLLRLERERSPRSMRVLLSLRVGFWRGLAQW